MVYLLIGGILLLIVAPIIRILPSRRQKEQMALRRTASSNGLTVELTHIDDPDPDPEKYLSNTGRPLPRVMAVIAYRKPVKKPAEWRRIPAVDWCVVRRQGGKATGHVKPPQRRLLDAGRAQGTAEVGIERPGEQAGRRHGIFGQWQRLARAGRCHAERQKRASCQMP